MFDIKNDVLDYPFESKQEETAALRSLMTGNASLSIDDLRRVAFWKLDRVINVPDSVIHHLQHLANEKDLTADSDDSRKALESPVDCEGVGFPMASAFLKFLRPDIFPIIDVRAYRALTGTRLRHHSYSVGLYLDYARRVREIANALGKKLYEIDEQLYCFDRNHNGAIDS